jgi:hypothetical protein
MKKFLLTALGLYCQLLVMAQCKITSELNGNGTVIKTVAPEVIYYNEKATMFSAVKYDGEEYYFDWIIRPFTKEKVKSKSMSIKLDNDSVIMLEYYDSYGISKDTSINILYVINKANIAVLNKTDIKQIDMVVDDQQKSYILVLHKELLKKQLHCIIESETPKEKVKDKDIDKEKNKTEEKKEN